MSNIYVSSPLPRHFDELMFIKAISSLSKLRQSLNVQSRHLIRQIPDQDGPWFFPPHYNLTAYSLEHILQCHYYRIKKFPHKSKFTIPLLDLTHLIRQAFWVPKQEEPRVRFTSRVLETGRIIGLDYNGNTCSCIKVISDDTGWIKTAYPVAYPLL